MQIANQQALESLQRAQELSGQGMFNAARQHTEWGMRLLDDSPPSPAVSMQRADLFMASGLSHAKQAVALGQEASFERAFGDMASASDSIIGFAMGTSSSYIGDFVALESRHADEEALSKAAEITAMLARVAFARQVQRGEIRDGARADGATVAKQHFFGKAHRRARTGRNQEVTADNAIRGAIAERANGRVLYAMPWIGRAAMSLVRAAVRDRDHFAPAAKTIATKLGALRSQRTALAIGQNWHTI